MWTIYALMTTTRGKNSTQCLLTKQFHQYYTFWFCRKPEECSWIRRGTEYFDSRFASIFSKLSLALENSETEVLFNKNMGQNDLASVLIVSKYRQDPLTDWMVTFIRACMAYGEVMPISLL